MAGSQVLGGILSPKSAPSSARADQTSITSLDFSGWNVATHGSTANSAKSINWLYIGLAALAAYAVWKKSRK
ncbi:hypothetical protein [Rhodocyclus gracilis]|uniref:Uncharacterized protein n=1 Tax=Rhodocyclus tenuis TaxID=1066 RepID=A0A6L5JTV1_RHOTE|nr:hypothetical protein [Rhodocyclus gracilis]MQY50835.1 hypothetical protein [Rhodocyclus gracilis]